MLLSFRHRTLDLTNRVGIVGIINVTPDSYVDGGKYQGHDALIRRAHECIQHGADIIEIGGESTGPGSRDVTADDEMKRVIPAVEAVRKALPDCWIAIDTWKSAVAKAAIESGADVINDITAGRGDDHMFKVLAEADCPCVLMYAKDPTARTTAEKRQYTDVISTIRDFLTDRLAIAHKAGIKAERIIVDPGLGHFVSSDPQYSFEILARLNEFADLGPVMVSPSRKSFLAGSANNPPSKRLPATLAATMTAVQNGARFIRTHDVAETRNAIEVAIKVRDTSS